MRDSAKRMVGFCLICACPCWAEVVVYPQPAGVAASDQYAVQVAQNGRTADSFVYQTQAKWRSNRSKSTSWTTFSFSGTIRVEVTKLQGPFSTCRVLPSSYRICPKIQGNSAIFELTEPRKISVEFDGDIAHPMLVFADPLETNVPKPSDPNVIYFGPGLHETGDIAGIPSNTTVYLAGGAYVKGRLAARKASGIKVRGRGILSGEDFERKSDHLVSFREAPDVLVEGVTLIDSPHYNLSLRGSNHIVRNVKMIGWYFGTDGVCTGHHGLVEDCFFKVNDDTIKLYHSDTVVRDCVIWQMENGAPFQISWNMPSDNSGFHVSNIDVIRVEHEWDNKNEAVFDAIHGGSGHMSDYVFEDVRIENVNWRLFYITIDQNEFADSSPGMGRISNITFRRITADGPMKRANVIRGWDADHRVSNVLFEDVQVNGRYLTSPESGNFQIDDNTTEGIRFTVSDPSSD